MTFRFTEDLQETELRNWRRRVHYYAWLQKYDIDEYPFQIPIGVQPPQRLSIGGHPTGVTPDKGMSNHMYWSCLEIEDILYGDDEL